LKEDSFILWLFEAGDFIQARYKEILAVVGVAAVAVAAGFLWSSRSASQLAEAGKIIAPARTAAEDGRYDDAIPIFERVKNEYGGTAVGLEATINLANARFYSGKYEEARKAYQDYLDEYGGDDPFYDISAKTGLAACDEQAGKFVEAAQQYQALADQHKDTSFAPQFLMDAARCLKAANQTDKAKAIYETIVKSYDTTRFVREARAALEML
jgi:TolA-binding protein